GPAGELGSWAQDAIAYRRWKWRVRVLQRAEQFLAEVGQPPTEVPLPILIPILEAGANEEDEEMSDRWAALLANAAGWPGRVPPRFPSILSQLSPWDAALLEAIFEEAHSGGGAPWESHLVKVLELGSEFDAEQRAVA